MWTYLSTG